MDVYLRESPRTIVFLPSSQPPQLDGLSAFRSRQASSRPGSIGSRRSSTASGAAAEGPSALLISTAANVQGRSTAAARAFVEMVKAAEVDREGLVRLSARPALGCLGLMNVGQDLFAVVVTSAQEVGAIRRGEHVMRISSVAFYCVNRSTWDESFAAEGFDEPGPLDPQGYPLTLPTDMAASSSSVAAAPEHPCASLKKLLGTGTFYYALNGSFDLSTRLQRRVSTGKASRTTSRASGYDSPRSLNGERRPHDLGDFDERFVWNHYMIKPLMQFRSRLEPDERRALDRECFLLLAIQGFVGVLELCGSELPPTSSAGAPASPRGSSTIALVSRLSWKRAGTRFNTRGIDDDGNVANFVESETLLQHEGVTVSYVQVRGSVPLFWEQTGLQAFNARIQVTRPRVASQPAFDRHFADLIQQYRSVHSINLLGTRDAETILTAAYAEHMRHSVAEELAESSQAASDGAALDEKGSGAENDPAPLSHDTLGLTNFDFHSHSRAAGGLDGVRSELRHLRPVQAKKESFSYTAVVDGGADEGASAEVYKRQTGVFRTNCLDCLDRTNVVQDMLSQAALELFLDGASQYSDGYRALKQPGHAVWAMHRNLWAENGDTLSKIYAGTGALNTSYTRAGGGKRTLGGFLSDAAKSAGRLYISNFQDKSKQNVIDVLLGNMANQTSVSVYDPLHDSVNAELLERLDEYSSSTRLSVFAGTWNVGGRAPVGESVLPWLCPPGMSEPDVYALGWQEVVPLTPTQILMADPERIRAWERVVMDALAQNQRSGKAKSSYVLLRCEQLVGTALMIIVKEDLIRSVRSVEAASRKTGLKGMSGNKGGVAIRLNVHDTSLCFVTAHLAAGRTNVEERNADYATIAQGLVFQRGKTIQSHDHVVWLGDFNYRIDLPNEVVRPTLRQGELAPLLRQDQLLRAKDAGQAFAGYEEGPLTFEPTYKYDVGTNVFDSSEKMRTPAWTDRVLYRKRQPLSIRLDTYARAELKTSDHRPVYATFEAEARIFDQQRRLQIRRELLAAKKGGQAGRTGRIVAPISASPALLSAAASANESDGSGAEGFEGDLPPPSGEGTAWWDEKGGDGNASGYSSSDGDEESSNPFLRGQSASRRAPPAVPTLRGGRPASEAVANSPGGPRRSDTLRPTRKPAPRVASDPQATAKRSATSPVNSEPVDSTTKPMPPPRPPKPSNGGGPGGTNAPRRSAASIFPGGAASSSASSTNASPLAVNGPSLTATGSQSASAALAAAVASSIVAEKSGSPPAVKPKPKPPPRTGGGHLTQLSSSSSSSVHSLHSANGGSASGAGVGVAPALPARPGMGSRTASYSSQLSARSQTSLLDDDDSEQEEGRSGKAMKPS